MRDVRCNIRGFLVLLIFMCKNLEIRLRSVELLLRNFIIFCCFFFKFNLLLKNFNSNCMCIFFLFCDECWNMMVNVLVEFIIVFYGVFELYVLIFDYDLGCCVLGLLVNL